MTLDVEMPDPPELHDFDPAEYDDVTVVADTNYRRDELQQFLREGAWETAWTRWVNDTAVTVEEFQVAVELDLFEQFDFFWDDFANRVGYHAPGIPADWKERTLHPDLDSWTMVSSINGGLTELGQLVCDVLKDEYIDWEAAYEPPDDLPDFE